MLFDLKTGLFFEGEVSPAIFDFERGERLRRVWRG